MSANFLSTHLEVKKKEQEFYGRHGITRFEKDKAHRQWLEVVKFEEAQGNKFINNPIAYKNFILGFVYALRSTK